MSSSQDKFCRWLEFQCLPFSLASRTLLADAIRFQRGASTIWLRPSMLRFRRRKPSSETWYVVLEKISVLSGTSYFWLSSLSSLGKKRKSLWKWLKKTGPSVFLETRFSKWLHTCSLLSVGGLLSSCAVRRTSSVESDVLKVSHKHQERLKLYSKKRFDNVASRASKALRRDLTT